MPSTTVERMRVDRFLSDFAISYGNSQKDFVAEMIAPKVKVAQRSGKYRVWDAAEDFRIDDVGSERRPGDRSNSIDLIMGQDTYSCSFYARHTLVPEEDIQEMNSEGVDLRLQKTARLSKRMLGIREKKVAAQVMAAGNYPASNKIDLTGNTNRWSTNGSDPFATLEAGILAVWNNSGVKPNRMLLGLDVAIKLRNHPAYIDRFKRWTDTIATVDLAPNILGMQPVIGGGQYNAAKKDKQVPQTLNLTSLWGTSVLLYYVEDDQIMPITNETLCTAKTFYVPSQEHVSTWFDNDHYATKIQQQDCYDVKLVAPTTAYLLTNVI